MSGPIADVIAALAVRFLEWWSARLDLKARIKAEESLRASEAARRALEYKISRGGRRATIERVLLKPGAKPIPGRDADA